MKRKIKIGAIYIFGEQMFNDDASKTIGAPLIGPNMQQIAINRREAKGKLAEAGQAGYDKALAMLREYIGAKEELKLFVQWDIHCGCSMCPCSPGYKVSVEYDTDYQLPPFDLRSNKWRDRALVSVYVESNGMVHVRDPKFKGVQHFVESLNKAV